MLFILLLDWGMCWHYKSFNAYFQSLEGALKTAVKRLQSPCRLHYIFATPRKAVYQFVLCITQWRIIKWGCITYWPNIIVIALENELPEYEGQANCIEYKIKYYHKYMTIPVIKTRGMKLPSSAYATTYTFKRYMLFVMIDEVTHHCTM